MTIRVFIDQGHNLGEINAGANGNGVVEAEVTYRVGKYLAKYLNTDPAFTARVSQETRQNDTKDRRIKVQQTQSVQKNQQTIEKTRNLVTKKGQKKK